MSDVFFASYANADRNDAMNRFVEYLRQDVSSKRGIAEERVCFFDKDAIRVGSEWKKTLHDGLRPSQVLVLFCSPRYVKSTYCGKEVRAFLDRIQSWNQQNPGQDIRAVFIVLWELLSPKPMPPVLSRFQYADDGFPVEYVRSGLRHLGALDRHRDSFREVALELSKRIHESVEATSLPHSHDLPELDDLASAWEWEPFNVSAVYWHTQGGRWKPFSEGSEVAYTVEQAILSGRRACREIRAGIGLLERLEDCRKSQDAVVVLTTLKELEAPENAGLRKEFDEAAPTNCGLLVVWEKPEDMRVASARLSELLPNRTARRGSFDALTGVTNLSSLQQSLATMVEQLLGSFRDADPQRRVVSAELRENAAREGVAIDTLPNLLGPGGKR